MMSLRLLLLQRSVLRWKRSSGSRLSGEGGVPFRRVRARRHEPRYRMVGQQVLVSRRSQSVISDGENQKIFEKRAPEGKGERV